MFDSIFYLANHQPSRRPTVIRYLSLSPEQFRFFTLADFIYPCISTELDRLHGYYLLFTIYIPVPISFKELYESES